MKDPVIRERFDDYRFANHKDDIIEPVGKVVRVSVEIRVRLDRQELAAPMPGTLV